MKYLLKHFISFVAFSFFTASCWGDIKPKSLKVVPDNCSNEYLREHLNSVLPCYLKQADPYYKWSESSLISCQDPFAGVKIINIDMDSQLWSVAKQKNVKQPIWRHRLTIYLPEKPLSDSALLYINGGTIYPLSPEADTPSKNTKTQKNTMNNENYFVKVAFKTSSVVIDLQDIPNQYQTFGNSTPLKEDALIAYTWERFLENPDKNFYWPLRLPMVKASVRAMDTVQSVLSQRNIHIKQFVLSGASKRGWTVWLTAAMDNRVSAIIPMVIDILNLQKNMNHHQKAYGRWAPAIKDYGNLMKDLNSKPLSRLMEIVDPYSYLSHLKMPKYIINTTGDNFFLPDASQFYFNDLQGQNWLNFLPDLHHYLMRQDPSRVSDTIESFYAAIITNTPLPEISTKNINGQLIVHSSMPPKTATLWQASNPTARDFRTSPDNPSVTSFKQTMINTQCKTTCNFNVDIKTPATGWNASFIELTFPNPPYRDLSFTSRVFITPDTYPEELKVNK